MPRPEVMVRAARLAVVLSGSLALAPGARGDGTDVAGTAHNLSASGPGPVTALTESRICVFCHTPHNGAPRTPLWNREVEGRTYEVYASPTLRAGPLQQPWGPTKLCLSCHDGTVALGAVLQPQGGIEMTGGGWLPPGSLSSFGLDLRGHHPVSFSYGASLPDAELASPPPRSLHYGGDDEVHCTTCHDPHEDRFGMFLRKDNRRSELCVTCHQLSDWATSAHATSSASVAGILPRPPKTRPAYGTLAEWGCETCHTPHFAPTAEGLLNFTQTPPAFSCTSGGCHTSQPPPFHDGALAGAGSDAAGLARVRPMADIERQIQKPSAHHESPGPGGGSSSRAFSGTVACADCHDAHAASRKPARAPDVSGLLRGASGVDRNGAAVAVARYEYEVCFKCHADRSADREHVPRVVSDTNVRRAFDPSNPSFHPVVSMGRTLDVPSIPSRLAPAMSPSTMIYCSDCHADDEGGAAGPHGSAFPPILRARYETADGTLESPESYALCYRCHDRDSILSDRSFRAKVRRTTASGGGHRGHLQAGIPCSACHDAHGVPADVAQGSSSHTHLINFDTRIVAPLPGAARPTFRDAGSLSGSCNLACHGVTHADSSYP